MCFYYDFLAVIFKKLKFYVYCFLVLAARKLVNYNVVPNTQLLHEYFFVMKECTKNITTITTHVTRHYENKHFGGVYAGFK